MKRWIFAVAAGLSCSPSSSPAPNDPSATPSAEASQAQAPSLDSAPVQPSSPPQPDPEPTTEPTIPGGGPDPFTLGPEASTSIGTPVEGRLEGGVPLPLHGPGYRFNPGKDPARRHGTVEVVQAVIRAAAAVEQRFPGGTVTVSDLAMPEGGDIPGHASHRSGRDVDIYFYLFDSDGQPRGGKAIPIEPDGHGVDYRDLAEGDDDIRVTIDVPRTWAFLNALVGDPKASLNRIFVVEHIRSMLLAEARRQGASQHVIDRFSAITCQPGFPHDDHMHIRFFCSPDDIEAGCEDTKPFYPWHLKALAEHGLRPKLAGKRSKPRPKLTSTEDAAKRAKTEFGEFHPDVTAFLERRKAWAKRPHPGRRYCR